SECSEICKFKTGDSGTNNMSIQKLNNDKDFSDELFVLKLLSADIHQTSIRSAKELYLNAEYIRKIFTSESDQKRLSELYQKIKTTYDNSYTKYVHDGIANSGLLLADVHENIIKEDKGFLDILIPFMSAIHKQGMIHQLANIKDEEIWWCKSAELKEDM
ncbi:ABC-three component system protein, partial [Vibrio crassostreae]|uniref:ABC-three component system protein n=1 Tax=Vibrio crassostreae TaxID=246167 RepID=UPI0003824161